MAALPICLSIAGSDASGGAGIQADLKTFEAFDVYGASALTLLTAQNTQGVRALELVSPAMLGAQLDAVFEDLRVDAIKIGAVGAAPLVDVIAEALGVHPELPVVLDPVMVSKHGSLLLDDDTAARVAERLIPRARILTPNRREAAALLGWAPSALDDARAAEAAESLALRFERAVLVTGGGGDSAEIIDHFHDGASLHALAAPRLPRGHQHGAGCTLASAICAGLAHGRPLPDAVDDARRFVWHAMRAAPTIGHGDGPLHHRAGKTPSLPR